MNYDHAGITRAPGSADPKNKASYAMLEGDCTAKPSQRLDTVSAGARMNRRMRISKLGNDSMLTRERS